MPQLIFNYYNFQPYNSQISPDTSRRNAITRAAMQNQDYRIWK